MIKSEDFDKIRIKIPLTILSLAVIYLLGIVAMNYLRFERENAGLVEELLSKNSQPSSRSFSYNDLKGLPEPVQRYLKKVIPERQPYINTVYIRQRGDFCLGDEIPSWKSFQATQHFTVEPPGFIWDGSIEFIPFILVRVVDMYKSGEDTLCAKVASTLSIVNSKSSP